MKATNYMYQTVKVSFAAITLLAAAFITPMQAASVKNSPREIKEATDRLETLSLKIEKAIQFNSDALAFEAEMYELETAAFRLEQVAVAMEADLRYESPEVAENMNDFETGVAFRNLEQLNQRTENLIKYTAPAVTE
jgi:hypothetical protein